MDILGSLMLHHTGFIINTLSNVHPYSIGLFLVDRPCIEIGRRDEPFAIVVGWKSVPNTGRDSGLQQAKDLPRSVSN
jgi:hypothetical protein